MLCLGGVRDVDDDDFSDHILGLIVLHVSKTCGLRIVGSYNDDDIIDSGDKYSNEKTLDERLYHGILSVVLLNLFAVVLYSILAFIFMKRNGFFQVDSPNGQEKDEKNLQMRSVNVGLYVGGTISLAAVVMAFQAIESFERDCIQPIKDEYKELEAYAGPFRTILVVAALVNLLAVPTTFLVLGCPCCCCCCSRSATITTHENTIELEHQGTEGTPKDV